MDINEQEALVLSEIMKRYLNYHPRCKATLNEIKNIHSIIEKADEYFNSLKIKNILSGGRNAIHQ